MKYLFTLTGEIPSKKRAWRISRNGGMYLEKRIKDWNEAAMWEMKVQRVPVFTGPVSVRVTLYFKRERDLDNSVTTILDLIQEAGIIRNDREVVRILAEKHKVAKGQEPSATVELSTDFDPRKGLPVEK